MAGKVAPGGAIDYWLESAGLVNVREAGASDPFCFLVLKLMVRVSSSGSQNGRVGFPLHYGNLAANDEEHSAATNGSANGNHWILALTPPLIAPPSPPPPDAVNRVRLKSLLLKRHRQTGKSSFVSRNLDAQVVNIDSTRYLHDGVMIMLDVTNLETLERLQFWICFVVWVKGNDFLNRFAILGNKNDSDAKVIEPQMIVARSGNQYIEVLAITNENMEEPFVYLLQEYFGRPDLELAVPSQLAEPHVLVPAAPLVPNGIVRLTAALPTNFKWVLEQVKLKLSA
ncbi:unnamed protein product [Cuscuta campestris]|uniref:Uncharacterized protein n=1 Tax=Cuscuta campestris TaxID=132261 RepID=A0A484MAD3_9ASTE|nr:unnamed protein product [Cuscuta campestris]